jgi:hypothetical protein
MNCQDRIFRAGRPGQDSWDKTARTGKPEQDSSNKKSKIGQEDDGMQIRNARTGPPGKDCPPGTDSNADYQDRPSRTRLQGQNSQSRFCYDISLILVFILEPSPTLKGL